MLGSLDPRQPPDAYACVLYLCPPDTSVGFRQLAMRSGSERPQRTARAPRLRLVDLARARNGDPIVEVRTPGAGLVGGIVTTSAGRWDLGRPRTIGRGELRVKRVARVALRLRLAPSGRRLVRTPGRQRARIIVYHLARGGGIKVTMRQIRL